MENRIRKTRSVCPICMKNIKAELVRKENGEIFLEKECAEHGKYAVPVWRSKVDFDLWTRNSSPLSETEGCNCPKNCGLCPEHEIGTCCILLEVTKRCNLDCSFCFAHGGEQAKEPTLEELKDAVKDIVKQCKNPLIQLSGGEPTLRDDLPKLAAFAKEAGCSYVQINTNGIRLAEDLTYVKALANAGTDIIFLQFDGTDDEIYRKLRGKKLLDTKRKAIENCSNAGMGVTLVPTVVRGVNHDNMGALIQMAIELVPKVRGIHFQPVSYFGRIPGQPKKEERYTLDELMADICEQSEIKMESFMPSRCDHPLCGFHADFIVEPSGKLRALSAFSHANAKKGCETDNREYVARHWKKPPEEEAPENLYAEEMDFDAFLYCIRHSSLTLSAMAFQDAGNLNMERLHRCSLHVYDHGKIVPFCANYLSPLE